MLTKWIATACCVTGLGLSGCANLRPNEAFSGVAGEVQTRTGAKATWNRGSDADKEVANALSELLARELTANSAVQVALLNNRSVQATYEELGIAQAELVQAGLLKNPVFSALLRFPSGGGTSDIELSVSQNFVDLLSMPLRKKVAAAQYEVAKAKVAGDVVNLAADVREAFYTYQAAEQTLELRRQVVSATAASYEAQRRIREAGNTTELEVANQQAVNGQAKVDLSRAESDSVKAKEHLLSLLGLWGSGTNIKVATRLPELPDADANLDRVESLAIKQRLDLIAATKDLNAVYQSLGVTKQFTWLGDAELSVGSEREEEDGTWITGPGLSIPIPIFDTGAAQVQVAKARVTQATERLYALAVQIRSDVRAARADMLSSRERANYYRTTLIPLRHKITQQTELQYNAMILGVFQLLQAKRDEIDVGRDYIEAVKDYWLAKTELERAVGGRLPAAENETSTASQPSPSPAGGVNEHHH